MFTCALCGLATGSLRFCDHCVDILPRIDNCCLSCGRPLEVDVDASVPCASCQARPPIFRQARAACRYAFPIDRAIRQLKFRRQLIFAAAFAELIAPLVEQTFADRDALVPVPLHYWRRWRRGFNQAAEIGRFLSKFCGLPLMDCMTRTRLTLSQSGLPAPARRANVTGAFRLSNDQCPRYPLVIDDVITTGATADQVAVELLSAGARSVDVLAVARSG